MWLFSRASAPAAEPPAMHRSDSSFARDLQEPQEDQAWASELQEAEEAPPPPRPNRKRPVREVEIAEVEELPPRRSRPPAMHRSDSSFARELQEQWRSWARVSRRGAASGCTS